MTECGQKTVTTGGLEFTVMSSRERTTIVEGRFFKCIGRNCAGWTLFEHDQDIAVTGQAGVLGRKFERLVDTEDLVTEIKRLVLMGEQLPTDIRPPWEIDEARHNISQQSICYDRIAKAQAKQDKQQAAEDAKNDRFMKKNGLFMCQGCYLAQAVAPHCAGCGQPFEAGC